MQFGEIWFVNFEPSVGHEYQKKRPAVIIQSDRQLKCSALVTVMPLTSQIDKPRRDDILVRKNSHNNLFADSTIRVHVIASFDKSRFMKRIGRMDDDIMNRIKEYLKMHFGI
ncbi:MAG: type II toxin-antitoxin system PemK/MazF family toxin [Pseudomonadota bacterium]